MYSDVFCKVYNEFGWNYVPEAFSEQLLEWLRRNKIEVRTCMDLACGTGVLCEILHEKGIRVSGMDYSEGMIAIARERNPEISYEVADMVQFRPEQSFDLVTCTGDAINHIMELTDVKQIFANVYDYLNDGGYFIFDILNEKEVADGGPFDFDYSEEVTGQFLIYRDTEGRVNLKVTVFENGEYRFEEVITEVVHAPEKICMLLEECGFQIVKCADHLLEEEHHGTAWFIVARKPGIYE